MENVTMIICCLISFGSLLAFLFGSEIAEIVESYKRCAHLTLSSYDRTAEHCAHLFFESRKLDKKTSRRIIQTYAQNKMIEDMTTDPIGFRAEMKRVNHGMSDSFVDMLLQ